MPNQVAYGFLELENLMDERVTEAGVMAVYDAIDRSVAEHNRQMNALMSLLAEPTTDYQMKFKQPGIARLQPGNETSRARPTLEAGEYTVAFPIQKGDGALGATWIALQKMTVAEANRRTNALLSADFRWMRDHMLAALFADASWEFEDEEHGTLTVEGPANGDATSYLVQSGADQGVTDDHFLAQAAAISDGADPFDTIVEELLEHPENDGEVVVIIPTDLRTSVRSLAGFYLENNRHLSQGTGLTTLTGSLNRAVPGEVIGYHEAGAWIVHWRGMPSGYMVATTTDGAPALRQRQHAEESLQGFIRVGDRNDIPYMETQYTRMAGFGAYNRVGAVVYRVGNAAYAVPTGYDSPLF